ncbi:hypothetical protein GE21DRAFT_1304493 [Neurospora crassa]|nr:hypothetical protein B24P7.120 [imported] - Neurospora crassa [Neurospora crassa]KHE89226.1 hypothetical protein GE21DRAFT_1304493 [Neurospora crassa]
MYHFSRGDFRGKLVGWCSGHVCVAPLLPPVSPGSLVRYAFEPGSWSSLPAIKHQAVEVHAKANENFRDSQASKSSRYTPLTGHFIITSTGEHTLDTRNVASRGHREERPKRKHRRGEDQECKESSNPWGQQ